MDWEEVREIPPWGKQDDWKELNEAFRHLLGRNATALEGVRAIAFHIKGHLEKLFPSQDSLVTETCMFCHEPCCTTATVWLDFCDVLFLHMTDQRIPDRQLIERQPDSCRYHAAKGCTLPRLSRPWVCTLYFCPPQKALIRNQGDAFKSAIEKTIQQIKDLRKELEDRFIVETSGGRYRTQS